MEAAKDSQTRPLNAGENNSGNEQEVVHESHDTRVLVEIHDDRVFSFDNGMRR